MNPAYVIGVIFILLIIAYVVYPLYFEQYVLMQIPEYANLRNAVTRSKKLLVELIKKLELHRKKMKIMQKSAGSTANELLAKHREIVELEKDIESLKDSAKHNTGVIAALKDELEVSKINASEHEKMYLEITAHLKELNDTIIDNFKFKDAKLASKLREVRNTLISGMEQSRDIACRNKGIMLVNISQMADEMRRNINNVNTICDRSVREKMWQGAHKKISQESEMAGPLSSNIVRLYGDIENVISYIISNNFCEEGARFRVDKFETFAKAFVVGLCGSDDWKKTTGNYLDYLIQKPATYLPGAL